MLPQVKTDFMKAKYDSIGVKYNDTRKADDRLAQLLFEFLNPGNDGVYLDIGCGTGNYSNKLQEKGVNLIGIDPSEVMLDKAKKLNQQIDWRIGTAENTGLKNEEVEGIVGSLTIHHWSDLEKAFQELYRILKPAGRIVLFTSSPMQMKGYWLNHYFPKMMEASSSQMPALESVNLAITKAGFGKFKSIPYSIHEGLQDQFLYAGKHNPSLYLNAEVRKGISSFSSLSNASEVRHGLENLKRDISSRKINDVIDSYKNEGGDYLFITAEK